MQDQPQPTVSVAVGPQPAPATTQIIKSAPAAVREIKAGYKTTEFWLTVFVNVANVVYVLLPADSIVAKIAGLLVGGLTVFGYSQSRGLAKSGL